MKQQFNEILRNLRQDKNLTQLQLAQLLQYTQSNISEWEKGTVEPKASALKKIAEYFEVTIDYLLGIEDDFGVKTVTPTGDTYSSEEYEIIKKYRELNEPGKKLVKTVIDTQLETMTGNKLKKHN